MVAAAHTDHGTLPVTRDISDHLRFVHMVKAYYASQYYQYLFAEVISHDLLQEFQKSGNIMNVDVATLTMRMT